MKTVAELRAMCREQAVKSGWGAPGTPEITFPEAVNLIHSELSEALEAYRSHGMEGWENQDSVPPGKPEGVVPEIADAVIRCLHYMEYFGEEDTLQSMGLREISDVVPTPATIVEGHFHWSLAWLHVEVSQAFIYYKDGAHRDFEPVLIRLCQFARKFHIDLEGAVLNKLAYNAKRSYRHGGKNC